MASGSDNAAAVIAAPHRRHAGPRPGIHDLKNNWKLTPIPGPLGRAVAWKHCHRLVSLLADTDIVIVLAGMGGGTGGGVAPVVARLALDVGALTIAAVTMPFNFEGNRGQKAATSINRLRRNTDYLLTFSNQQLGTELGDNTLTTTIYEVQAQRIAYGLRDLLVNLRFD